MADGLDASGNDWLTDSELRSLEKNGGAWVKFFYPSRYSRPFTGYQNKFYEFITGFEKNKTHQPRVECEPRGVGKSSNLRAAIIYLLAKKIKFYVLYVSATAAQAKKHFAALKKMLENPKLIRHYPHLRPQTSKHRNAIVNWSADRLVTDEGQVIEFVSILGNARGFNTEEGLRLDFIALDDLDDQKDSVAVTEKKLDILGSNILGAGDETTDIVFAQNLIHRTSICTRLRDNNAGILLNRRFVGPFPLCKSYAYEEIEIPGDTTGAKQYIITDFQPYDAATSKDYVQILLNRLGQKRFERECQQNLSIVDDDKDFREYSEIHHVITYSEFLSFYKKFNVPVWNRERNRLQIPSQWNVGLGQDWGTTPEHPTAIIPVTRPNKNVPLSNCFFIFGEVVLPEYPHDVNKPAASVSPRKVAVAEKNHLNKWNVRNQQITLRRMSHEASAALNAFADDLEDDLKIYYSKWKASKGSGVPQMQNVLEIDYSKPHAFRKYPDNYPDENKRGKPIIGMPKLLILVPDDQGQLMCEPSTGHLYVAQPYNAEGCARLRGEFPVYNHRNTGKSKIFDDAIDGCRGMIGEFVVMSQELTKDEKFQSMLREKMPHLLAENIDKVEDSGKKSALIQAAIFAYEEFEQEQAPKYEKDGGFNEFLREMGENASENDFVEL